MKPNYLLALLLLGFLLCLVGALVKIQHWPGSSTLSIMALGCWAAGLVGWLIKLLRRP